MSVIIRPERASDANAIRVVNVAAFETPAEADLVAALSKQVRPLVCLVAARGEEIIGHILFSPVSLGGYAGPALMGLAPMAVHPAHQRQGVGSSLVRAGLAACRALGAGAVVVLGHPAFYPRFGFQDSARFGLSSAFDAPPGTFMVLELAPGTLHAASGTIRYHEAFQDV